MTGVELVLGLLLLLPVLGLLVLLPVLYFYKDSLPLIGKPSKNSGDRAGLNGNGKKNSDGEAGEEGGARQKKVKMRRNN